MPRRPTFPPRLYLHRASGQARVRVAGKDYYLGRYGSPEAAQAYARLIVDLTATGGVGEPKRQGSLTVAEAVGEWLRALPGIYPDGGNESKGYKLALAVVCRLYGSLPAKDFDSMLLMNVQAAMASGSWMTAAERDWRIKHKQPIGWCRNVTGKQIARVRTVWKWLEQRKLVPMGIASNLRTVCPLRRGTPGVRITKKVAAAAWEDVRRVIRKCRPVIRATLLVGWWSGARTKEIRLMRWSEIDQSGDVWIYRPTHHKTEYLGQERAIMLGPKCQAVLRPLLSDREYVFEVRPGCPYVDSSYAKAVRVAARRAGVVGFHSYRLRHSARLRLTRLYGLDATRAILGHTSLSMTASYASQQDLATAKKVAGQAC